MQVEQPVPATGLGNTGLTVWFTGLSGSGKSTIARGVLAELERQRIRVELLDADRVRPHLAGELGFDRAGREENVRRLAFVAGLLSRHGVVVLVAAMSPYREGRQTARAHAGSFLEVFVDAPLPVCEARDPVGLYRRFRTGEIRNLSGMDEPYEAPLKPDVHCRTAEQTVEACIDRVLAAIGLRLSDAVR